MARQADGKIVAAGFSLTPSMRVFTLARYTASGGLDASFGSAGIVATPIGVGSEGNAIALQPDSRIIVAGYAWMGSESIRFALARYLSGPVCGNGIVEPGEACDDGNTAGGDCCGTTCQPAPAGSSCNDGNACTVGETCNAAGVCGGFTSCRTSSTCNICGSTCALQAGVCKCG